MIVSIIFADHNLDINYIRTFCGIAGNVFYVKIIFNNLIMVFFPCITKLVIQCRETDQNVITAVSHCTCRKKNLMSLCIQKRSFFIVLYST